MELDDIRSLRERIANLSARHAAILQQFWNPNRFTFGQFGADDAGMAANINKARGTLNTDLFIVYPSSDSNSLP